MPVPAQQTLKLAALDRHACMPPPSLPLRFTGTAMQLVPATGWRDVCFITGDTSG